MARLTEKRREQLKVKRDKTKRAQLKPLIPNMEVNRQKLEQLEIDKKNRNKRYSGFAEAGRKAKKKLETPKLIRQLSRMTGSSYYGKDEKSLNKTSQLADRYRNY